MTSVLVIGALEPHSSKISADYEWDRVDVLKQEIYIIHVFTVIFLCAC